MAEIRDEAWLVAEGYERVYAEWDWYDGPRSGLALIAGVPHYFRGDDYDLADEADAYRVWPANAEAVAWEREQWAIFARWYGRSQAGTADASTDPHTRGADARYDELTLLLAPFREPPDDARTRVGQLGFDAGARYRVDGVDYWFRWIPPR